VLLPSLGWGEKDGTVTNSERRISRQRRFLPAPGEAKADWWQMAEVGRRMGFQGFDYHSPAEIFGEHAALSAFENEGSRDFDIGAYQAIPTGDYDTLAPFQWPQPAGTAPGLTRFFADGGFYHPDGKARFMAIRAPETSRVNGRFGLTLNTGRIRDQWHTMTRTGKPARLLAHRPEPFVLINAADAAGLRGGGLALVESRWGSGVFRVYVEPSVQPGTVYVPMHWTDRFCPQGRVNPVVNPETDPVSGQPELKHTPVSVRNFAAAWYGFLLARRNMGARLAEWCATLPASDHVWRHELAGTEPPHRALARLTELIGSAGAEIALRDEASGLYRTAFIRDGRLIACLFIGRSPALPARDWLVGLFRQECLSTSERRTLLAGRPAEGPAPEAPVCICHGVGSRAIHAAIAAGFKDVEAIGRATRAGTNCGSCRPEIRALLAETAAKELA
jgi:assimilatory nitrate reductase catalytic subunit